MDTRDENAAGGKVGKHEMSGRAAKFIVLLLLIGLNEITPV